MMSFKAGNAPDANLSDLSDSEWQEIESKVSKVIRGDAKVAASRGARIGLVCSLFNSSITKRLLDGALEALDAYGISPQVATVTWVPGAFEIPLTARRMALSNAYDAIVCLGSVIRGDTPHFDYVAGECAAGIRQVMLEVDKPVVFGVLTTDNEQQALERSEKGTGNKGYEAVTVALKMVDIFSRHLVATKDVHKGLQS